MVQWGILLFACLLLLYMWKVANEQHIRIHEANVVGEMDTFRLFFISDLHNRKLSPRMIANIPKVEAVIIGGDLCDRRTAVSKIEWNIEQLKKLGPVFFVWGNNDREIGEERLRQLLAKHEVMIVENEAILLDGRANRTWIAATDYSVTKFSQFECAITQCKEEDVVICVAHNPEMFPKIARIFVPSLFLGGHLHGGQIRFGPFGIHPNGSYVSTNGVATLISNGYGTTLVPFRFGARPEVHVITVRVSRLATIDEQVE